MTNASDAAQVERNLERLRKQTSSAVIRVQMMVMDLHRTTRLVVSWMIVTTQN